MNKAVLVGRLTKDPELRYTQSNIATLNFTLAVNRNFKNADGKYDADFIPIVVWRGLAEMLGKYLKKGARVAVSGRIQTRSYDGQDGQKRYVTELVAEDATMIDFDSKAQNTADDGELIAPPGFTRVNDFNDEVPF